MKKLDHQWRNYIMFQSLWKIVWQFLKQLKIELTCDPAIPLLGIYLKELKTDIQMKICVWVNVYSSSTPKSQKVEPTQTPTN